MQQEQEQQVQRQQEEQDIRIVRETEMPSITGLSTSSIRNRIKRGSPWFDPSFPLPVRLGGDGRRVAIGWYRHEVNGWVKARQRVLDAHQLDKGPKATKRLRPLPYEDTGFRL